MTRFTRLAAILPCVSLAGCAEDEACLLMPAPPVVTVEVTDASTREHICDAEVRVTAHDLDYQISPTFDDRGCLYIGWEGQANAEHTVTVSAPGYRPFTTKRYMIGDPCGLRHVPGQDSYVAVRLEKQI